MGGYNIAKVPKFKRNMLVNELTQIAVSSSLLLY